MPSDLESRLKVNLAQLLDSGLAPKDIDPDVDMADEYGLTSLNKVVFLMQACDESGVSLSTFTEPDLAQMRTLRDVTAALARHTQVAA